MSRIWAVVLSVWAMLFVVAVLAWSYRPAQPAAQAAPQQALVLQTVNGKRQLVAVQPAATAAPHATTATSAAVRS